MWEIFVFFYRWKRCDSNTTGRSSLHLEEMQKQMHKKEPTSRASLAPSKYSNCEIFNRKNIQKPFYVRLEVSNAEIWRAQLA
jgi:hypothetical protein